MQAETDGHSANHVVIRAYCDADWSAVCMVHDRARPDELRGSCDPRAFVPLAAEQDDAAGFQRSRKFVACRGKQIVGFVGIDGAYLAWLYVDSAYSGQGIGRRLLRVGLQRIGPQAWTVVLAGHLRVRRLYESEGLQVVRTYASAHAGYPCTWVQLAWPPAPSGTSGSSEEGPKEADCSGMV
jgi:GNAT superfamily N-acetyltransferase